MDFLISLGAAVTLTGWSERTFWRKFAEGSVRRETKNGSNGKSLIDFDSIEAHLIIPLEEDDIALIQAADAGDAEARNSLALLFLANDKPKSAIYWLELAAKQNHADAMHWLGRCYLEGNGVIKDENLGIMWLSKAAACGHVISQGQMQAIRDKLTAGS